MTPLFFDLPTTSHQPPSKDGAVNDQPVQYRHYKGGLYDWIGVATHEGTGEAMVVYRNARSGVLWVRPPEDFSGTVWVDGQWVPRFALVEDGQ